MNNCIYYIYVKIRIIKKLISMKSNDSLPHSEDKSKHFQKVPTVIMTQYIDTL